jgi:hypothetical protein
MAKYNESIIVNNQEWNVPKGYTISPGRAKEILEALAKNNGKPLNEEQLAKLRIGSQFSSEANDFYFDAIDANTDKLNYNSSVYLDDLGERQFKINNTRLNISEQKKSSSTSDYESMVEAAYEDRLNLMTDPTGANAQRFRDTMYGAIAEEQAVAEQSLGQAELDAYRMLGQQQLELENTIAEQRKKALVSGTTSAQLAAGQLQNMFAAQSGAAQVAQSLANQRTQMNQTFAEKRTGVETSLYDYINQQQTIAATAGAQNLAALSSYASYANKNYNDMMGLARAKADLGVSAYNKLIEDIYGKEK